MLETINENAPSTGTDPSSGVGDKPNNNKPTGTAARASGRLSGKGGAEGKVFYSAGGGRYFVSAGGNLRLSEGSDEVMLGRASTQDMIT